jgi:pyruvate-formate lyase-activating enzyme
MIDAPIAAFLRAYPLDGADVRAALAPWTLAQVAPSALRAAVDLVVADGARRITICIEPRVAGAAHLAATRALHLSYYADDGIDHAAAATIVRALAAALAIHEAPGAPRFLPVLHGAGQTVVELRINRACNERCRFCNTPADSPTILPDADAVLAQIAAAARAGCRELLLTGRETTLEPRLAEFVAAARAAGIATIRVQTNGTTLHHRPLLDRLIAAGMNAVEVSLHTLDPATFEALIGPAALLDHALAGLDALATVPAVRVHLVMVATARNAAELPALIDAIAARWPAIRSITLSPVAPVGDGATALELLLPYDQLAPLLADALRRAAGHGITAIIPARCGLPPCALPADVRHHHAAVRDARGGPIEPGKHKPAACARCALDRTCGGAWTAYLQRFGDAALAPIA